jgi:hypothetical protein
MPEKGESMHFLTAWCNNQKAKALERKYCHDGKIGLFKG